MSVTGPSNQTELLAKLQDGTITQDEKNQLLSRNSGLIASNMQSTATDFTKDTSIPTVGGITSPINEAELVAKLRNGTITQDEKKQLLTLNGYQSQQPSTNANDQDKGYDGGTVASGPDAKSGVGAAIGNGVSTGANLAGKGFAGLGTAANVVGDVVDGKSYSQIGTDATLGMLSTVASLASPVAGAAVNSAISLGKSESIQGALPGVGLGLVGGIIGGTVGGVPGAMIGSWAGKTLGDTLADAFKGTDTTASLSDKGYTGGFSLGDISSIGDTAASSTGQSTSSFGGLGPGFGETPGRGYGLSDASISSPNLDGDIMGMDVGAPVGLGDAAAASMGGDDGNDGTGSDSGGSAAGSDSGGAGDGIGGDNV